MTKPRPFGQYFILEKIAQGGMAEIFKGLTYDFSGLKKFIVIKRILPHIAANEDFIRMLVDEAKIAVHLNHGNIAQTFDLGKVADDYFIVMEYVEGHTISQIFKKSVGLKENIPIPMAAYIVSEICHGLDYIHRRQDERGLNLGIVHCDISPQNVIVSRSGTVKIVDFGVAKAAFKLGDKERGVLKGKFAYMSPEQTEGIYVEATSDIFSTGVVLWEMVTGRRLFKKKINSETIQAVKTMSIYPPSAYRNEIPSELDEIVMKSLARDPRSRYQSATDMALALTKFNLKYYPDFKPVQIGALIESIFEDEENTGDVFQEKTQFEEVTIREGGGPGKSLKGEGSTQEDTLIVDPQELDFHSIFEEIEVEEGSEITRALDEEEGEAILEAQEEPTGDLPPEHQEASEGHFHHLLETAGHSFGRGLGSKKKRVLAAVLGFLGGLLFLFFLYFLFSKASAEVVLHREGYLPLEREVFVFPSWDRTLRLNMKKSSAGVLEVSSHPPGAAIYLDGQATGKVTPALFEVRRLKFPVVLMLSQGEGSPWKKTLSGFSGKNLKVHADLTVPYGTLDVRSSPSGAQVILGGKSIGKTPIYAAQVPAGEDLELSIGLKGYRLHEQKLFLKPGENEEIFQALQKNPSR